MKRMSFILGAILILSLHRNNYFHLNRLEAKTRRL